VTVSGVRKSVELRGVEVRSVASLCQLSLRPVALPEVASGKAPREVLAFAMKELRRVAEAKKGQRIARRLAALAEGKCERASPWSSRKSLRGVC
jgi:hypothetical protein